MTKTRTPLVLIILDGWGEREQSEHNAIAAAKKPHWDYFKQHYPNTRIEGSGLFVGLPAEQMGNSEVGHLTLGAGRIVYQDLTRIDLAIKSGEFLHNPVLEKAINQAKENQGALHLLGLTSPGGVHSHENHLLAMVQMAAAAGVKDIYIHAFLDGRDTPPRSALKSLEKINSYLKELGVGYIVSLIGRYYAMDRDKRWDRIEKAYNLITQGTADFIASSAEAGLLAAYERGENDEFVQATSVRMPGQPPLTLRENDVVIFMNFRADRARELTQAFTSPNFSEFERKKFIRPKAFICLTQYDIRFPLPVAFGPVNLIDIFPAVISKAGLHQLRIAETEKYAHVTFFFNGGVEAPYVGEERILIPSPKVSTYDLQPAMSAPLLTKRLVEAILSRQYEVIICNFANPDMVGHTGQFSATVSAIETIDQALGDIYQALQQVSGEMIITADHGNAECMFDPLTNQPHTAHTSDPVPFIYIGKKANIAKKNGTLADIAPTMLYLLGLPIPSSMTGESLVEFV